LEHLAINQEIIGSEIMEVLQETQDAYEGEIMVELRSNTADNMDSIRVNQSKQRLLEAAVPKKNLAS
jgi:hypothetical protein